MLPSGSEASVTPTGRKPPTRWMRSTSAPGSAGSRADGDVGALVAPPARCAQAPVSSTRQRAAVQPAARRPEPVRGRMPLPRPGAPGGSRRQVASGPVRLVIARCSVDYIGRLTAHLPMAPRLLLVKADGSVSIHADDRAYKPLNWMSPPCSLKDELTDGAGTWTVTNKAGEQLIITIELVEHDSAHELGVDPGLQKDGVEAELQRLLALHVETFGSGSSLVRREYLTAIGPVDLLCRDAGGKVVAVEIKRRGEIDGAVKELGPATQSVTGQGRYVAVEVKRKAGIDAVEQLTRYLELLNRDPLLRPVSGLLAAQSITQQARVLAKD